MPCPSMFTSLLAFSGNFTDIILAHRLRQALPKESQVVSILTTQLWAKEKLGTILLRRLESTIANALAKPSTTEEDWQDCLKLVQPLPPPLTLQQRVRTHARARVERVLQPLQERIEPYYKSVRPYVARYLVPALRWTTAQALRWATRGYRWSLAQMRPYWQKHVVVPLQQYRSRLPAVPTVSSMLPKRFQT